MPLRKMWRELSPNELALYRAKYNRYPFGSAATDLHFGILSSAVVNSQGGKSKPRDFMLSPPPEVLVDFDVGVRHTAALINAQVAANKAK